jgi:hypothetical protein
MRRVLIAAAVLGSALGVLVGLQLGGSGAPPAGPMPHTLHTVWCVKAGYPRDLAGPWVVGPGTGLAGCPAGLRQVPGGP